MFGVGKVRWRLANTEREVCAVLNEKIFNDKFNLECKLNRMLPEKEKLRSRN